MGISKLRRASASGAELQSEATVLGQRSQRLVRQVSAQSPQVESDDRSPCSGHVSGQGTVFQHGGVCPRLQLSTGIPDEPRQQMQRLVDNLAYVSHLYVQL